MVVVEAKRLMIFVVGLLLVSACSPAGGRSSSKCKTGATEPCACPDGSTQTKQCVDLKWGECPCPGGVTTGETADATTGETTGETTGGETTGETTGGETTGGETTGGETEGGTTGGETGPVGACVNPGDLVLLASGNAETARVSCTSECVGQIGCAQTCMQNAGMSADCAACWALGIDCMLTNCSTSCGFDPAGAECTLCTATHACGGGFKDCAGVNPDGTDASGTTGETTGETTGGETTGGETTGGETTGGETTGGETTGGETTGGETTGGETTGGETTGGETTGGTTGPLLEGETCPPALGYEGCCDNNALVWCENGKIDKVDCMQNPVCGWQASKGYYDCGSDMADAEPTGMFPLNCADL